MARVLQSMVLMIGMLCTTAGRRYCIQGVQNMINVSLMMNGWTVRRSQNASVLVFGLPGKLKYLRITFCMSVIMALGFLEMIRVHKRTLYLGSVYSYIWSNIRF